MNLDKMLAKTSKLTIVLIEGEKGDYTAIINEIPEAVSEGNTIGEAIEMLGKQIDMIAEIKKRKDY